MGIVWIPGILGFTTFPNAKVYEFLNIYRALLQNLPSGLGCEVTLVEYLANCCLGRYALPLYPDGTGELITFTGWWTSLAASYAVY
jgi:hypothetical protein